MSLAEEDATLDVPFVRRVYEIDEGVPVLLPEYDDEVRRRFLDNYDRIALDDLRQPFEPHRDYRHDLMREFIGDVRGSTRPRRRLERCGISARDGRELRVAVDIALPYLKAVPPPRLALICADAEYLPSGPAPSTWSSSRACSSISSSGEARRTARWKICDVDTRVIIEFPWRENPRDTARWTTFDAPPQLRQLIVRRDVAAVRDRPAAGALSDMREPLFFRLGQGFRSRSTTGSSRALLRAGRGAAPQLDGASGGSPSSAPRVALAVSTPVFSSSS